MIEIDALATLNKNNYLVVDNFIEVDRANFIYEELKNHIKNGQINSEYRIDGQCPLSYSLTDYRPFIMLLVDRVALLDNILGQPVLPTYAYGRLYQHAEELKKHTDRPECECSVTVHLGSDGTEWPIWFTRPDGTTTSVNMKPGQGIIYKGMESVHWREGFKGQEYGQVFLHYVRAYGAYWDRYFDKKMDVTSNESN